MNKIIQDLEERIKDKDINFEGQNKIKTEKISSLEIIITELRKK